MFRYVEIFPFAGARICNGRITVCIREIGASDLQLGSSLTVDWGSRTMIPSDAPLGAVEVGDCRSGTGNLVISPKLGGGV